MSILNLIYSRWISWIFVKLANVACLWEGTPVEITVKIITVPFKANPSIILLQACYVDFLLTVQYAAIGLLAGMRLTHLIQS
uniref:Uncharacterized protein n=1 Tax=Glossina palpalis gambiensis TaxID=67801 RepID=A0A1B0BTM4_9MUSC